MPPPGLGNMFALGGSIPFSRAWILQAASRFARSTKSDQGIELRLDFLPSNVLEHVFSFLDIEAICCAGQSCPNFLVLCADSAMWFQVCKRHFSPSDPHALQQELGLRSYQAVYAAVSIALRIQGLWRMLQDYPWGNIIAIRYDCGQLIGEKYEAGSIQGRPRLFVLRFGEEERDARLCAAVRVSMHRVEQTVASQPSASMYLVPINRMLLALSAALICTRCAHPPRMTGPAARARRPAPARRATRASARRAMASMVGAVPTCRRSPATPPFSIQTRHR